MAVFEDACYVAIRDVGLIKFPESLRRDQAFITPSNILTEKDGLPSVSITGTTAADSKLWIAYGGLGKESGLIIFEPKTGYFDTIFCSALDGAPPFNAGKSYALSFLTPGPDNKLFFIMGERGRDPKPFYPLGQWWGLWGINTKTRVTKFIWRDENRPMALEAINNSGGILWLQDLFSITQFDPDSEKARFVLGQIDATHAWQTTILKSTDPMPELQRDLFVPESSIGKYWWGHPSSGRISLRTAAVYGNKLWARLGEGQLIVIHKGKGFEEAEVIYNNILNGGKVLRFFSTPYGLIAIGEGTVGLIETSGKKE